MRSIEVPDAQDKADMLLDLIESGVEDEIILISNGRAAARIVPLQEKSEQPSR